MEHLFAKILENDILAKTFERSEQKLFYLGKTVLVGYRGRECKRPLKNLWIYWFRSQYPTILENK